MNRLKIDKITETEAFTSLREDWQGLFAVCEGAPFLSWEWQSAWFQHFGGDRTPFILKVTRDNELIGILPLCLQERKILGMRLRRLGFVGESQGGADYLDLIASREDRNEILAAIRGFLETDNSFDVLLLENLADNSEAVGSFKKSSEDVLRYNVSQTLMCPQIDLVNGWEAVLKQSARADNFKRRLKKLEKLDGFEFRSVTSPDEVPEAFERFYSLHEKRWEKSGGSELCGHPRLLAFQREVVKNLKSIRFEELWVEGECRASVYGLDDGRTFYYYNSGYDLSWANRSVGLVLIGLSIKNAIARGNTLYDFLRGDETYKFDWANRKTELVTVNLSRRNLPAMAFNSFNQASLHLRNVSTAVLPADFAENLKTWKRNWLRNRRLEPRAEAL